MVLSGTAESLRPWRQPLWLLVAGYWLWLVWACAGEWLGSEDYSYGWFVPPLALYFLWKRMEGSPGAVQPSGARGCGFAWAVIIVSLLVIMPLEVVRQTPIHWRPNLWAVGVLAASNTMAVAWLTGGRSGLKLIWFPALFMLLGIPWPTFAENMVSFPLMQLVARWAVVLLHIAGHPATASGTTIALANCTVGVEEACSGLRSLQTALMVGVAAGELVRLTAVWRVALLAVAFVMAVAGNQARVLLLALVGASGGSAAVDRFHDTAGYVVLAILLGGVGIAAAFGRRWQRGAGSADSNSDGGPSAQAGRSPVEWRGHVAGWSVFALACAAMLGAHAWFWMREHFAEKPAPALLQPAKTGGFAVDADVPPTILSVLQPDEYSYIRETSGRGVPKVIGYHFYWKPRAGNANQLYHRPDRCMPGAGWRIDGEVTRETIRLGGRDFVFNRFPLRGPGGSALLLWGAFLNGEPVEISFNTDVYLGTANLWHFVRTGTRVHSYEVAAFVMPYMQGNCPTHAEIEAFASKAFAATQGEED